MEIEEKLNSLTETVEKIAEQVASIMNIIDSRAIYEEESHTVDVDGVTMTLAEYDEYIRKLELDNRLQEAKRLKRSLDSLSESEV